MTTTPCPSWEDHATCGGMPPDGVLVRLISVHSSSASCIEQGLHIIVTVPFLKWPDGVQLNRLIAIDTFLRHATVM